MQAGVVGAFDGVAHLADGIHRVDDGAGDRHRAAGLFEVALAALVNLLGGGGDVDALGLDGDVAFCGDDVARDLRVQFAGVDDDGALERADDAAGLGDALIPTRITPDGFRRRPRAW